MKLILTAACIALGFSGPALAFCKFKAADGSWTYAKSCKPLPQKEIDGSAALTLKRNAKARDPGPGVEPTRLRGYEYADTTHSGMRIRMVEPNRAPADGNTYTSQ